MRTLAAALIGILACAGPVQAANECAVAEHLVHADFGLPRVAAAIDKAQRLDIAVVGTGSSTLAGPRGARTAYPAHLETTLASKLPGIAVKVVPVIGLRRTAAEQAKEFERLLVDVKPALVVWQTGTADAMRGVQPEEFRAALDEGIDVLQAGGADVILMNMQYSPRTESMIAVSAYAELLRFVALEKDVTVFDRYAVMKHWGEVNTFDLGSGSKDPRTAEQVHECIGRLLAGLVIEGANAARTNSTETR